MLITNAKYDIKYTVNDILGWFVFYQVLHLACIDNVYVRDNTC